MGKVFKILIMNKYLLLLLCVFWMLVSCGESNQNRESNKPNDLRETATTPEAALTKTVEKWNEATNLRDQKSLEKLFADQVYFYTLELSGTEAARQKVERANSDPTWSQKIISDIDIDFLEDGSVKTSFTKQSDSSKGTHTYRAYLIWEKVGSKWFIIKESDLLTDQNQEKHSKIPDNAISGDFDGDGKTDHVWIEARYDDGDYIIGKAKLRSDNKALEGLTFEATRGVGIENLGRLSDSQIDFLGVIPAYDSSFTQYYTYVFSNGRWIKPIPEFSYWENDDDTKRVVKPKSGRYGYVGIYFNDLDDPDNGFKLTYKEVKLNL